MDNPTIPETAGVLPQVKGEMLGKSGLNVLGNKGVSLGMDDSASIRDYLQQMIQQRQSYKGSFEHGMDQMRSVLGDTQNQMAQNMQAQSAKERGNEQDVFNMRVNMAQLKTQEDRLLQEKQQKAQQMLLTENAIRAASGLPPLTSLSDVGGQGAPAVQGAQGAVQGAPNTGSQLTPAQTATIRALQQTNPDEALKQVLALTKPTDLQRELSFLSPAMQQEAIIAARTGDWLKPLTKYDPEMVNPDNSKGGNRQTNLSEIITNKLLGVGSQPVAAQPSGARPSVTGPLSTTAAQPAAQPAGAPPSVAGPLTTTAAPVAPAPAPVGPAAGGNAAVNIGSVSSQSPDTAKINQAKAEAAIKVEQERQIASNAEAIKVASKASEDLHASASAADNNIMIANRITQNVEKVPELVNLLGKEGVGPAILNLASQGLKTPGGQISVGGIEQLAVQLDPSILKIKDPKVRAERLSAAQELARDFAYLALQGSKMVQGQGAVSDNERNLIKQAVGDPSRLTPQNIMNVAKAIKYEATNAKERRDLWNQMSDSGMTYQQFRRSPEYAEQSKKQYARMARILGVKDAPPFDPALERQ